MKTMNKTLTWLVAAVLSLSLVTIAEAQSGKQRTGKVVRIKGDARYSTGNKVWQPLKVGALLKSGYTVQTAKDSFVDVVVNEADSAATFSLKPVAMVASPAGAAGGGGGGSATAAPDQDVIRILDDSFLVFDSLTAMPTGADTVTETLLDLKKGSIFGSVKKQAAASRFEVKIPNGVAGIRGTIFLINANGMVSCVTGSVIAAYTDASGNVGTQTVGAGQQFNTATGEGSAMSGAAMSFARNILSDTNYSSGRPTVHPGRGRGWGRDMGHDHISTHKPGPPPATPPPAPPNL
jgi:hypothetical protein